jgi:hypothetical protein
MNTEHSYIASVPGLSVEALFADNTANGNVRTVIGKGLGQEKR